MKVKKLLGIALAIGLFAGVAHVQAAGGAKAGQAAPALTGKGLLTGKSVSLSSLKGRVVLVDFWASWCAPCKEEMPVLQKLHAKYGKQGLTIVGVSVDNEEDKARSFAKKMKVTFPLVHDVGKEIAERYKPAKMPTSFIVDRAGKVRFVHAGFTKSDASKFEKEIKSLL